jgi:hypothetical protein
LKALKINDLRIFTDLAKVKITSFVTKNNQFL